MPVHSHWARWAMALSLLLLLASWQPMTRPICWNRHNDLQEAGSHRVQEAAQSGVKQMERGLLVQERRPVGCVCTNASTTRGVREPSWGDFHKVTHLCKELKWTNIQGQGGAEALTHGRGCCSQNAQLGLLEEHPGLLTGAISPVSPPSPF